MAGRRIPKVVLLIESSRSSGRNLLLGIAEYARHHGPWAFYWEPGGLEKAWPLLKTLNADGIILRDVEKLEEVRASRIPAIVVGHSQQAVAGSSNVITDSTAIAGVAAEHLLDCGFRHFAFVGFAGLPWSMQRAETFSQKVAGAGSKAHLYSVPGKRPLTWPAEQAHMARWLKTLPKPIGVMACNDDRGENVIEACKIAGLRVPDEVAIIGADNDELVCELSDPPLSSVAINFHRAGYESAHLLDRLMKARGRRGVGNILVPPTHVVPRQSTDILFVDDPAIARGLRFIRQHARRNIGVRDVVQAAGLSRRVVEQRFRRLLGRSVLSEIRRARTDQIARMLMETNQSVSEIAFAMGFEGVEHVARYFRQEKQMTPLAYRKRFGRK